MAHNDFRDFVNVRIGPRVLAGHEITLRSARFDDFDDWRRIRLRDQSRIEPFWITDPAPWSERHTRRRWVRECLESRTAAKQQNALSLVIDVDGRLRGQCGLSEVDFHQSSAELGAWVDAELPGAGALAVAMLIDHATRECGLTRVIAINRGAESPAGRQCRRLGARVEAVMAEALHVGGERSDHTVWSLRSDDLPPNGLANTVLGMYENAPTRSSSEHPAPSPRRAHLGVGMLIARERLRYLAGQLRREWRDRRQPTAPDLGRPGVDPIILRAQRRTSGGNATGTDYDVLVDGRFVGRCGLRTTDWVRSTAELWLSISSGARNADIEAAERDAVGSDETARNEKAAQPLHARVLGILLRHVFDDLGMHRAALLLLPSDTAELVAVDDVGMTREGSAHASIDLRGRHGDHELWAIIEPTWRRQASDRSTGKGYARTSE